MIYLLMLVFLDNFIVKSNEKILAKLEYSVSTLVGALSHYRVPKVRLLEL